IAGSTDFDANLAALDALRAEWGSTTTDYMTRIKHLMGTLGGGLNGPYALTAATVHDDGAVDSLYSAAGGLDWYIYNTSATAKDKIFNKRSGEVATGL